MHNIKILLIMLIGIALAACATIRSDDKVLSNAAVVLHQEGLEAEAKIIEDTAVLIGESRRKGESSVYIGFAPDQRLRDYALRLKEMGRTESAQKLEKYADEYYQNNLRGFLYQMNR